MKKLFLILTLLFVTACGAQETVDLSEGKIDGVAYQETSEVTNFVKIVMDNNDVILIELYPEYAPITVENFQNLVGKKFYDGTEFHRVIEGFMIQGGISARNEQTETIVGEFPANGVDNPLLHERGVISMARTMASMDSASSQFFIMHQNYPSLDGEYAAFGRVIAGMDAIDRIATTEVAVNPMEGFPRPVRGQIVKSIRFVTIEQSEN